MHGTSKPPPWCIDFCCFTVTFVLQPTHPDEPALEVTHFYYLSWPDHGVPTNSASLINFVRRVRKVQPHSTEVPLLVHCSAGVGRTGTFIAIDIEMQTIEAEGVVDVYGCTKKLRTRRVLMVQTLVSIDYIASGCKPSFCVKALVNMQAPLEIIMAYTPQSKLYVYFKRRLFSFDMLKIMTTYVFSNQSISLRTFT